MNSRIVPVFYHIPKCVGSFIKFKVMVPSLRKEIIKENALLIDQKKTPKFSRFSRFDIHLDNSLKIPGKVTFFVGIVKKNFYCSSFENAIKLEDFKEYLKEEKVVIYGATINPITGSFSKSVKIIEDCCNINSCKPSYFTIMREPFDWHNSFFYYLRDVGTWERTYGIFKNMTFKEYIKSTKVSDSWVIRNLTELPNNVPITEKDYKKAIRLLSKFDVGIYENLDEFFEKINKKFGFSVCEQLENSKNENKISKKTKFFELSKEEKDIFNERTKFDAKLYNNFKNKNSRVLPSVNKPINTKKMKLFVNGKSSEKRIAVYNKINNLLLTYYGDFFEPTNNLDESDFIILGSKNSISPEVEKLKKYKKKIILFLSNGGKDRSKFNSIRIGKLVDQKFFDSEINNNNITIFSSADVNQSNVISKIGGYISYSSISQEEYYWLDFDENNHKKYYNKLFWSGNNTHSSREIINELKKFNNPDFEISFWKPKGQNPNRPVKIYGGNKPVKEEYISFFNKLKESDISISIRGDRPWTNTFFDYLRASNAIACIDTNYDQLGWEKIGINKDELFWFFDTDKDSPEKIYKILAEDLQNKDKILRKKKKTYEFYKKYILTDRLYKNKIYNPFFTGLFDFYVAKLIEIKENDYKLKDNCLFSPSIYEVKDAVLKNKYKNNAGKNDQKILKNYKFRAENERKIDMGMVRCTVKRKLPDSDLKKIQNVSFPRSGHALLRRCLQLYFGNRLRYCQYYKTCKKVPCKNPQTNYQKNHDFDLKLENNPRYNFLIQYRHPLESIISFYKFDLYHGFIKKDSKKAWELACKNKIDYWKKFVKKWVINNKNPNTLFIQYNKMIDHPEEKIKDAILYLAPGENIDGKKVKEIVREMNIKKRVYIKDFKYYDESFFRKMEDSVRKELDLLNLKRIFNKNK
jgi:hypothetical protein